MTERKLKQLVQILNENEIIGVGLSKKGHIVDLSIKLDKNTNFYFNVAGLSSESLSLFPDNFYEEEEYLELKTLDELRAEFAHVDIDGLVSFQEEDMLILNPGMVKGLGKRYLRCEIRPAEKGNVYCGGYIFDRRWFR